MESAESPFTLRLLTINIHKGFSFLNRRFVLHQLRDALAETEADVVFLQEVTGENITKARKHTNWPEDPHYEFLADSNWRHYVYGKNVIYPSGHHGNAILSKYHILESERIDISTNIIEKRGFLYCKLDIPASLRPVHCICVHLSLAARSRNKQFRMLETYIEKKIPLKEPLIIAGDFNEWRKQHRSRNPHNLGLKDAIMETKGKMARTYPSWLPIFPLDRIWLRGLEAIHSKTFHKGVWARLSDHAALYTEAEITDNGGGD